MAFTRVWDLSYEGNPPDSQLANLLGLRIRELKLDIRERGDIEHDWGSGGGGRHKFPRGNLAGRPSVDLVAGTIYLRTDRRAIDHYNGTGWDPHYNYEIGDTTYQTGLTNVPTGYIFFNTDLGVFEMFDGTNWVPLNGTDAYTVKLATVADEPVSGSLSLITGMSQTVAVPNDGVPYEILAEAVVHYGRNQGSETLTIELRRDTVQKYQYQFDGGTLPDQPQQTAMLIEHFAAPVNGTTYTYDVRGSVTGTPSSTFDIWNPNSSFSYIKLHLKPRLT